MKEKFLLNILKALVFYALAIFIIIVVLTYGCKTNKIVEGKNSNIVQVDTTQYILINKDTLNILKENILKYKTIEDTLEAELIALTIYRVSQDLPFCDAVFLSNLIAIESSFKYDAVSKAGAIGLMQIRPIFWMEQYETIIKTEFDFYNPIKNIIVGSRILHNYYLMNNSLSVALHKYSGGSKRHQLLLKRPFTFQSISTIIHPQEKE